MDPPMNQTTPGATMATISNSSPSKPPLNSPTIATAPATSPAPSQPSAANENGGKVKKPPPAPVRLPHRVADYFLIVGGIRQYEKEPEEKKKEVIVAPAALSTDETGNVANSDEPAEQESKAATASPVLAPTTTTRKPSKFTWIPKLLDRYPRADFKDAEFPKDIEMFLFPSGTYELTTLCQSPEPHCFVLTEADGTRVYGVALKFWEPLDEKRLGEIEHGLERGWATSENEDSSHSAARPTFMKQKSTYDNSDQLVYAPKCFVILSHWPYYSNFERFLTTLHKNIYINSEGNVAPLERVLLNFIQEVPLPPQGKFEVESKSFLNPFMNSWLNTCPWSAPAQGFGSVEKKVPFLFSRPPPNKSPLRDFPLSTLFRWLSLENIFQLYAAVLTEKRVLFVSDKYYKLTIAAETITYLLNPFYWRHIYIPLLPARLTDFICAPMPYIVGIHRSCMPDELLLDEVIVVDLDNNMLTSTNAEVIPPLPSARQASLYRHLKKLVVDPTTPIKPTQTMSDADIETAFLKFHVRLFENYREYLEAPSEFVIEKFQKQRFIAEHPESKTDAANNSNNSGQVGNIFLIEFMETQMFQCFIDDRYDQSTRQLGKGSVAVNFEVLFFDETIDLSLGKPAPFLQDSSQNISPAARVIALPPNTDGLIKGALYKYTTVPVPLNTTLFIPPREVKDLAGDDFGHSSHHSGGSSSSRRLIGGVDMERLSMKFFQEKRLYSQHFHTLRLRSAKQDTLFKDIQAYFRGEQGWEEAVVKEFEKMCSTTVDKNTPETGTTIDQAWLRVRRLVQEQLLTLSESFRLTREEVCMPLYNCCSEHEHQLKILFSEAHGLEQKAAKGKSVVERTKQASMTSFARYEQLRETYRDKILTTNEITKITQAQNESEDARLNLDESETSFHTILAEYELRMPQIISAIRQLNKERIIQAKESFKKWIDNRRANLVSQLAQLDRVATAVDGIDGEKDLISFSEGTTDFWMRASSTVGAGATISPAIQSPMDEQKVDVIEPPPSAPVEPSPSPPAPAATAPTLSPEPLASPRGSVSNRTPPLAQPKPVLLCYPLHMWGPEGFERASTQAGLTRKIMKEFILAFTAWSEIIDMKSKKLSSVVKNLQELPNNPPLSSGQKYLWDTLRQRSLLTSKSYADFQQVLLKLISDLSLTTGELKYSLVRFKNHRLKLEKEVAASNEVLAKSFEKKERTSRNLMMVMKQLQNPSLLSPNPSPTVAAGTGLGSGAFPPAASSSGGMTARSAGGSSAGPISPETMLSPTSSNLLSGLIPQRQLEIQASLLERTGREAKEAAHEYELNQRNMMAVQRKHDICISRLLRLFEKKEKYCLNELKKALSILTEQFHTLLISNYRKGDETLQQAIKKIDLQAEMKEFIENAGGRVSNDTSSSSPPNPATSPTPGSTSSTSSVTSPVATSPVQVDFGRHLPLQTGYASVYALLSTHISFLRTTHFLLEELSQTDDLEVKALKKCTTFKIRSCRPGTSLQASALAFEQLLDRLTEITEDNVRVGHDLALPFSKLKSSLKTFQKAHEQRMNEIERAYRKVLDEKDRAVANERGCEDGLKIIHIKVDQAQREEEAANAAGGKKGLFSSFMSTPLRDLQSKEASAAKDLEKAKLITQEKESALLQAINKKSADLRSLLQEMQTTDTKRWKSHSEFLNTLLSKHALHLDKMQTLVHNFSTKVNGISVESDLNDFLTKNTTKMSPPEYVKEDYKKYVDAVALQIQENEKLNAAQANASIETTETKSSDEESSTTPMVVEVTSVDGALLSPRMSVSKRPTTHHGYSNSMSMFHQPGDGSSYVPPIIVPPPASSLALDFNFNTRPRGSTAQRGSVILSPNQATKQQAAILAAASTTVTTPPKPVLPQQQSQTESQSSSTAPIASPQFTVTVTSELSNSLPRATVPTDAAADAADANESSTHQRSQSSSSSVIYDPDAVSNELEYQDENGDWIKSFDNTAAIEAINEPEKSLNASPINEPPPATSTANELTTEAASTNHVSLSDQVVAPVSASNSTQAESNSVAALELTSTIPSVPSDSSSLPISSPLSSPPLPTTPPKSIPSLPTSRPKNPPPNVPTSLSRHNSIPSRSSASATTEITADTTATPPPNAPLNAIEESKSNVTTSSGDDLNSDSPIQPEVPPYSKELVDAGVEPAATTTSLLHPTADATIAEPPPSSSIDSSSTTTTTPTKPVPLRKKKKTAADTSSEDDDSSSSESDLDDNVPITPITKAAKAKKSDVDQQPQPTINNNTETTTN